jgi:hypothetical protein
MGTIRERNGRFTAQIRIMRDKRLIYQQAQTFDRRAAAVNWIKKREQGNRVKKFVTNG